MNNRQGLTFARMTAALAALAFALVVAQGCGGGDHADDGHGNDEGEHGEAEHGEHGEHGEAEHGEADHGEADHGDHGPSADFVEPKSYTDACSVIHARLDEIDELLKSGRLHQVADEAAVIRNVANGMARLATVHGSGVPSSAIKEVNLTAKQFAAKFDAIHVAGDSGDAAGTRKAYGEMVALYEILEKYSGAGHDH